MLPVGQQVIKGGRVGEGGVFAGRGVEVLLLAVGTERRCVERDQSCAAGLGAGHILDGRVNGLHRPFLAGDEADASWAVGIGAIVALPGTPNFGIFMDIASIIAEEQIGPGQYVLPILCQSGMLQCILRDPGAEEGQQGLSGGGIHTLQNRGMKRLAGGKARKGALRVSLIVCAQNVAGVIAQKIGGDPYCAFDRSREREHLGGEHSLFPSELLRLNGRNLLQRPVCGDRECIGGLDRPPAGAGKHACLHQSFVILGQRLQNHPRTSPLSRAGTSSTPSRRVPRKNRGRISSGFV